MCRGYELLKYRFARRQSELTTAVSLQARTASQEDKFSSQGEVTADGCASPCGRIIYSYKLSGGMGRLSGLHLAALGCIA